MIASASALTACGDPESLRAFLPTANDSYTVFALTGTPAAFPSAINTFARAVVRVDGNANFDVAFDLDGQGRVIVLPVQKVVSLLGGTRRVGLRKVEGTFDAVSAAPTGTYGDSVIVASPGEVIVAQSARNGPSDACQFDISPFIYTKLVIDSVASATRTIFVRTVLDPNCGFRSFEAGVPAR